jgi:hypothetical protein
MVGRFYTRSVYDASGDNTQPRKSKMTVLRPTRLPYLRQAAPEVHVSWLRRQ